MRVRFRRSVLLRLMHSPLKGRMPSLYHKKALQSIARLRVDFEERVVMQVESNKADLTAADKRARFLDPEP